MEKGMVEWRFELGLIHKKMRFGKRKDMRIKMEVVWSA